MSKWPIIDPDAINIHDPSSWPKDAAIEGAREVCGESPLFDVISVAVARPRSEICVPPPYYQAAVRILDEMKRHNDGIGMLRNWPEIIQDKWAYQPFSRLKKPPEKHAPWGQDKTVELAVWAMPTSRPSAPTIMASTPAENGESFTLGQVSIEDARHAVEAYDKGMRAHLGEDE